MTYGEIFFKKKIEKTIDYNKIIMSTQNNLISIIGSAEQEPKFIILVNG